MSHPHLSVGGCPACLRITPAGPLGFLPLILSADVRRNGGPGWQRRISSRVPRWVPTDSKVYSHKLFFNTDELLFKLLRAGSEESVSFEFVRVWTLNDGETEVLGAGSVTGVGLTIKRLTQQVAVRLFHNFPPLWTTQILSVLRLSSSLSPADILSSSDTCCWHFVTRSRRSFSLTWQVKSWRDQKLC